MVGLRTPYYKSLIPMSFEMFPRRGCIVPRLLASFVDGAKGDGWVFALNSWGQNSILIFSRYPPKNLLPSTLPMLSPLFRGMALCALALTLSFFGCSQPLVEQQTAATGSSSAPLPAASESPHAPDAHADPEAVSEQKSPPPDARAEVRQEKDADINTQGPKAQGANEGGTQSVADSNPTQVAVAASDAKAAADGGAEVDETAVSEEAAEAAQGSLPRKPEVPNVDANELGDYLPSGGADAVEDLTMPDDPSAPQPPPESAYAGLVNERKKLDETVWKNEVLAQEHEQVFTWLWDRMLGDEDHYKVLAEFPFETIVLPNLAEVGKLDWGIRSFKSDENLKTILFQDWKNELDTWQSAGYRLLDSEWHHLKFDPAGEGVEAKSTVSYTLYVDHPASEQRFQVKGNLIVAWSGEKDGSGRDIPSSLDARDVSVLSRQGKPGFEIKQSAKFPIDKKGISAPTTLHPLMTYDLDDDGDSELLIGGYNILFRNDGEGKFRGEKLIQPGGPKHTNAGLVADLNGDGYVDLVLGLKAGPVVICWGDASGEFRSDRRSTIDSVGKVMVPSCIAAGDIDNDNDLDLYLTQLRPPYLLGKVPVPFFDANDGFPSYMLLNDGKGNFTDVTELAGLGPKRFRRTFSSTFLDLDEDGDQDLIVVSDFSGLDVYFNNGKGGFDDVTSKVAQERSAFGMSHTIGDYDLDGKLDFYMIGMSSTTARRLDHMGLRRDDKDDFFRYADMRKHMGYGNRMYLASFKPDGVTFQQAPWNGDVARTGWSWGSTTFDFDNDSDSDVYVANGQLSGKTTKDYCTRFWCHDIYIGNKSDDAGVAQLINEISPKLGGHGMSWNGYEHDALFMNISGHGFTNIAFLMGCDLVYDCRSVISDDIDMDGRVDLIVEENRARDGVDVIHILRNVFDSSGHWIGFRFPQEPGGESPIGAKITLEFEDGAIRQNQYLVGHSVWAQHAAKLHFGLGERTKIKSAVIHWPSGKMKRIDGPGIDQYHRITP